MPKRPQRIHAIGSGALLTVCLLLLVSCASGPKYGASRKQSKSCECPHWNAVMKSSDEVHASVPDGAQR